MLPIRNTISSAGIDRPDVIPLIRPATKVTDDQFIETALFLLAEKERTARIPRGNTQAGMVFAEQFGLIERD